MATRGSASSRRTTKKERYYRTLLKRQRKSGVSLREVAEEEGIPPSRLRGWKSRIQKLDRQKETSKTSLPKAKESRSRAQASAPFLPVRIVGGAECADGVGPGFEVMLRSGHLVRVPRSFESEGLGRLVRVLESAC